MHLQATLLLHIASLHLCAQPLASLLSLLCVEVMLEEEVREAVISTAGTAAGARAAGLAVHAQQALT